MPINTKPKISEDLNKEKKKVSFEPMRPKYSFEEVILNEYEKERVLDSLCYNEHHELVFNNWGLNSTHKMSKKFGINLYGPPGTGKTMIAHAIAKHLKRNLIQIDYSEIESKYVGETSKNLVSAFAKAKETKSILLFDEADAILSRRVSSMTNATDVSVNQTRSVLLTLMNDYDGLIIFTTNFIENYDPAFMRRILAHIEFELPDILCRQRLWKKYIPESLPSKAEIKELAEISETLSGSDISNCVLKAAMSAARQNSESILIEHFEKSIKEVINSKNANSKSNTKIEKKSVSETYVESQIGTEKMMELKA